MAGVRRRRASDEKVDGYAEPGEPAPGLYCRRRPTFWSTDTGSPHDPTGL